MYSRVIGIIEMDAGTQASQLTPYPTANDPGSLPAQAPEPHCPAPLRASRSSTLHRSQTVRVQADTDRLTRQLRDEYRRLLLQFVNEKGK